MVLACPARVIAQPLLALDVSSAAPPTAPLDV
jgi:hypothetical protein